MTRPAADDPGEAARLLYGPGARLVRTPTALTVVDEDGVERARMKLGGEGAEVARTLLDDPPARRRPNWWFLGAVAVCILFWAGIALAVWLVVR